MCIKYDIKVSIYVSTLIHLLRRVVWHVGNLSHCPRPSRSAVPLSGLDHLDLSFTKRHGFLSLTSTHLVRTQHTHTHPRHTAPLAHNMIANMAFKIMQNSMHDLVHDVHADKHLTNVSNRSLYLSKYWFIV